MSVEKAPQSTQRVGTVKQSGPIKSQISFSEGSKFQKGRSKERGQIKSVAAQQKEDLKSQKEERKGTKGKKVVQGSSNVNSLNF